MRSSGDGLEIKCLVDHARRGQTTKRFPETSVEEGYVSLELVLGLALLVLPIALIVLTLPTWLARQNLARLAAQQAARTGVIAASPGEGAMAAGSVVADAGLDPARDVSVAWDPASNFARGGLVTVHVTVESPAIDIPFLGRFGSFPLTASFSERVDPYRSGP
ncbi:MAG TPA: hypothetical protein VN986_04680 [Actinomycetota bacterium]|nr:hypothetical protein [Actinomycetota bacterium]